MTVTKINWVDGISSWSTAARKFFDIEWGDQREYYRCCRRRNCKKIILKDGQIEEYWERYQGKGLQKKRSLRRKGYFEKGYPMGAHLYFWEDGSIQIREFYNSKGESISYESFNKEGELEFRRKFGEVLFDKAKTK